MSEAALDPYAVLGVTPDVSDIELRRVYRGLVKRHHPDHNGGSAEAATRFAQIQSAYASVTQRRRTPAPAGTDASAAPPPAPDPAAADPGVEERIAAMERELAVRREAEHLRAQQQAQRAAAAAGHAQAAPRRHRPTPEELGYYTTDDSFTKIIDDAAEQLGERLSRSDAKRQFTRRLSDLFGRD